MTVLFLQGHVTYEIASYIKVQLAYESSYDTKFHSGSLLAIHHRQVFWPKRSIIYSATLTNFIQFQ